MTVLVTGAAGFLGSHIVDLLVGRQQPTRALVRPGDDVSRFADAGVEVCVADVCDPDSLTRALVGVDRVLHCAARTGPWGPDAAYERTNVRGLERLVNSAITAGVKRIVHVSSITVHGNDVAGEADERSPLALEPNPYSRSKVAGERLLWRMIAEQGAPVTIVRPGWIYGPRDAASFGRLARAIETGRMAIVGSGHNHLPLIYVEDAARGVLDASAAEAALGRAYLLVSDEPVTQRDFVGEIAAELGAPMTTHQIPYRLAVSVGALAERFGRLTHRRDPPPVMRYGLQLLGGENRFNIARARRELGFSPQIGFREGVRRSVSWYRSTQSVGDELAVAV
jgi:nucleoside-diphosphate-sugar epimerase